MLRLLLGAAITAALMVPIAADAAKYRSHKRYLAHHGRMLPAAPVGLYGYRSGGYGYARGWNGSPPMAGPSWSGPNQCWEDLGYGRYEKCNW